MSWVLANCNLQKIKGYDEIKKEWINELDNKMNNEW